MTPLRLVGGRVVDPANGREAVADILVRDGRIVATLDGPAETIDVSGAVVMAGGIDIHSHIAGLNVGAARLLLPETEAFRGGEGEPTALSSAGWSAAWTGTEYARLGYTLVVEPAMAPASALRTHAELADIPVIDRAALTILGNDRRTIELLDRGEGQDAIDDHVASTIAAASGFGLKVINAGAAAAFGQNIRRFDLDDTVPDTSVSSRAIVQALHRAALRLGLPHPLHLHCNRLGSPGAWETVVRTMDAAEGQPIHLAHAQFYAYKKEGKRKFASAASEMAEALNARPHVTADVGQVMFGQTVTISGDVSLQFGARSGAAPNKWSLHETDGNGFGIVPFRYRETDYYNAVQFAAGLELFLLVDNPWQVFFTTDHPNGAPFTTYPDLIALLMSRDRRAEALSRLPAEALEQTILPSITREYTLSEIAILTRASPARLLGLPDRGHLGPGAVADIAVYRASEDRAEMFRRAHVLVKDGAVVVRDGRVVRHAVGRTLRADLSGAVEQARLPVLPTNDDPLSAGLSRALARHGRFEAVPCRT